jgi:hypothetical protein
VWNGVGRKLLGLFYLIHDIRSEWGTSWNTLKFQRRFLRHIMSGDVSSFVDNRGSRNNKYNSGVQGHCYDVIRDECCELTVISFLMLQRCFNNELG